jgi:hypothetical protein
MTWPLAAVIIAGIIGLAVAIIAPLVVVARMVERPERSGGVWMADPLPPPTPPPPLPPRPPDDPEATQAWPKREEEP